MNKTDDTIFLLRKGGRLERVPKAEYDSEDLLQSLLDNYPDLLAGEQIQPEEPIRWLIATREAGIPDFEGGSDRWAVDHLLLDQHARPTFVEVKRSKDPRIRREVIGQMLDYAANAQSYWPVDRIRSLAASRYGGSEALDEEIRRFLYHESPDDAAERLEAFWAEVDENLRGGRVRLLFVADELPRELRRVIEFLNEQMPRVEVLGIEVRQYVGDGIKALVPRLVGQTEFARQEKRSPAPRIKIDRASFLAACSRDVAAFFSALLDEAEEKVLAVGWAAKSFSIKVQRADGKRSSVFYGYMPGAHGRETAFVQIYLGYLTPEDDIAGIRRMFLGAAPFNEQGQDSLELVLTGDNVRTAERVKSALFRIADKFNTSDQRRDQI